MESKKIYGVDLSGEITPVMVRDALLECFSEAHKKTLEQGVDFDDDSGSQELRKLSDMNAEILIKKYFEEVGGDFENPKKEDFVKVMNKLAEFSRTFRGPEIVEKHYGEIMELVERL